MPNRISVFEGAQVTIRLGAVRSWTLTPSSSVIVRGNVRVGLGAGAGVWAPEHAAAGSDSAAREATSHFSLRAMRPSFRSAALRKRIKPPFRVRRLAEGLLSCAKSAAEPSRGRSPDFRLGRSLLASAALPRTFPGPAPSAPRPSGISRVRSLVTVARPCRTRTGFPLRARWGCRPRPGRLETRYSIDPDSSPPAREVRCDARWHSWAVRPTLGRGTRAGNRCGDRAGGRSDGLYEAARRRRSVRRPALLHPPSLLHRVALAPRRGPGGQRPGGVPEGLGGPAADRGEGSAGGLRGLASAGPIRACLRGRPGDGGLLDRRGGDADPLELLLLGGPQ